MERGRRLAIAAIGLAVTVLTVVVVLRVAGDGGSSRLATDERREEVEGLSGDVADDQYGGGVLPGDPPQSQSQSQETTPPLVLPPEPTMPPEEPTSPDPSVYTIPLPDFGAGAGTGGPGSSAAPGPAFPDRGVWVVKANGTSPILVARNATSGVAAAGTWVAFVEGTTVAAVRRSDLRTRLLVDSGVSGTAAQGLPIAGGRRGVAFLKGGKAHLVDPGAPDQRVSFDAPGANAVGAEEDGEGRLVWADDEGIHAGREVVAPAARVERGILAMGHDLLAHLQGGQVNVRNGPSLSWGSVDRLQTGTAGLVAGSGGKVRLRTPAGDDRVLLDQAATPVLAGERILYVSASRTVSSASLTGGDVRTVAQAAPGRSITNLDLLDDSTLVVTVG